MNEGTPLPDLVDRCFKENYPKKKLYCPCQLCRGNRDTGPPDLSDDDQDYSYDHPGNIVGYDDNGYDSVDYDETDLGYDSQEFEDLEALYCHEDPLPAPTPTPLTRTLTWN